MKRSEGNVEQTDSEAYAALKTATGDYRTGLIYVFGGAFVVALIISLLMKLELKRMHRQFSVLEVEAARPHTHDA